MIKNQLNWKKIWTEFDKWFQTRVKAKCPKCRCVKYEDPEWSDQQKKIQELIEKRLKIT